MCKQLALPTGSSQIPLREIYSERRYRSIGNPSEAETRSKGPSKIPVADA